MTGSRLDRIRVLIPTGRHVYRLVSYGMIVDFEDAVARASDTDLLPVPLHSRRGQLEGLLRGKPPRAVTPPRSNYDVCLLVAMDPYWMPSLRYVRNLRRVAQRVVVYLFDSWLTELHWLRDYRALWPLVDDLVVSFTHAVQPYREQLPCRVHYLPQAIEERWFAPYGGKRVIDVLSMGRRLPTVHAELLEIARRRDLFYHYQTHAGPQVMDFYENQELIGRLCQLAGVHVGWRVDMTNPLRRDEGAAITARWYESAASGALILGSRPRTDEFARLFPYSGFVLEAGPDGPGTTEEVLDAALSDDHRDERLELAEHVRREHTWSMRWRQIAEICGL